MPTLDQIIDKAYAITLQKPDASYHLAARQAAVSILGTKPSDSLLDWIAVQVEDCEMARHEAEDREYQWG
jgi:hypothetical protein